MERGLSFVPQTLKGLVQVTKSVTTIALILLTIILASAFKRIVVVEDKTSLFVLLH